MLGFRGKRCAAVRRRSCRQVLLRPPIEKLWLRLGKSAPLSPTETIAETKPRIVIRADGLTRNGIPPWTMHLSRTGIQHAALHASIDEERSPASDEDGYTD